MEDSYRFFNPNAGLNNYLTRIPESLIETARNLNGKVGTLNNAITLLKNAGGPEIDIVAMPTYLKCSFRESGMNYSYKLIEYAKK
jgi:hypothetical protein